VVGAIFHDTKAKQLHKASLVAAAECKNPQASPEGGLGVFDKMLQKPCPYHQGLVKHTLKECGMMKCYFSEGAQWKGNPGKRPKEDKGDGKEKDDDFPVVNNCLMIFDGPAAYDSRR
jgi:hypothetical protein